MAIWCEHRLVPPIFFWSPPFDYLEFHAYTLWSLDNFYYIGLAQLEQGGREFLLISIHSPFPDDLSLTFCSLFLLAKLRQARQWSRTAQLFAKEFSGSLPSLHTIMVFQKIPSSNFLPFSFGGLPCGEANKKGER